MLYEVITEHDGRDPVELDVDPRRLAPQPQQEPSGRAEGEGGLGHRGQEGPGTTGPVHDPVEGLDREGAVDVGSYNFV